MIQNESNIDNENMDVLIDESFEEILQIEHEEETDTLKIETEPLCASCYEPLDVDEDQTTGYCEKCDTEVFVHRRIINSSFNEDCSL